MPANNTQALYAKLAEVAAEVGWIAKDGTNTFQNYKYTSAEAVLSTIRGPLNKRSIVCMPSVTAISEREYTTSKGKASVITTVHMSFTFVDGETGEQHQCEWAGQGDDPGDKGLGKAFTNAAKTFVRAQFLIPQGDDPEADAKTDERGADRAPSAKQELPQLTSSDVAELKAAAKGLKVAQIKMALTSVGLSHPANGGELFGTVPKAKLPLLVECLSGIERES